MANRVWKIDGEDITGAEGAVLNWEGNGFFTLSFNGNTFSGEVLEENIESNFLKLKINHRVFEIRKKGELDDFIAQAERDRQMEEKPIQSKINTQKRKISMKEMLLTNFKTELDAILNS